MSSAVASELPVLFLAARFEARGSWAYTLRLLERLPESGVFVEAVCPAAGTVEPRRRQSLHIREYPYLDHIAWGRLVLRRVARDVASLRPQLIHIHSRRMLRTGIALSRRLNCPYLATVHDHLRAGERLPLDPKYCAGVIAVSSSVAESVVARTSLPRDFVHVIPSGIETGAPADCSVPLEPGRLPVVGTAGALEAVKGFPYLLSAAQQVLASGRDVEFLLAGAGPEESNLRKLARELEIAHRVTFVPYALDFSESLAAMDIFVLPSLQQGLGTVMLEAMSLGRPVIASDVGGVHGLIQDGKNGLTVPPASSDDLARRIIELLNDPERARRIGSSAREFVQREFSVEQMVRSTVELYHKVLRKPRSALHELIT